MKSARPAWIAVVLFTLAAVVLLTANRGPVSAPLHETSDYAANSLLVLDAKRLALLTGNYSRVGFNHPGPALMYVQAAGEAVFHDRLRIAGSPVGGQLVATTLLAASWLALLARLWMRLAGSVALGLAGAGVTLGVVAALQPLLLTGMWYPELYALPFSVFCVAAACLAEGRLETAWVAVLAAGTLVHGHASFIAFVGAIGVVALAIHAMRLRTAAAASGWRSLLRAEAARARLPLLAAAILAVLFAAPIVLNTILHFPGELPKYVGYGVANAGNSVIAAGGFVARFWGGPMMFLATLTALALVCWRPRVRGTRPLALVTLVATGMLVVYAKSGIDDLRLDYTAYFYRTVVALGIATVVLEIVARIPVAGALAAAALAAAASLFAVTQLVPAAPKADPAVPALAAALTGPEGGRAVLDLRNHGDWQHVWSVVAGAAVHAKRQGRSPFCIRENWHIAFTRPLRCTPDEARRGATFVVTDVPVARFTGDEVANVAGLNVVPASAPRPAYGERIAIHSGNAEQAGRVVPRGWFPMEAGATWSEARGAAIRLRLPAAGPARLVADTEAFLPSPGDVREARVSARGMALARWSFAAGANRSERTAVIPADAADANGVVEIRIDVEGAVSPKAAGVGDDVRVLGIALHALRLESVAP